MDIKKSLLSIAYSSWCGLGFIWGKNSYKYKHDKKEKFLHLDSLCYGILGTVLYANLFLSPLTVYKELYRIEIYVRNLDHEKNTVYYNNLI